MSEKMFVSGFAIPAVTDADEVRQLRNKLKLTQKQFAELLGCSMPTVERMESAKEQIKGPAALLIRMIRQDPDILFRYEIPPMTMPMRLWYMHRRQPCTVIDADISRRKVRIHNFVDHVQFRAFGNVEKPTYEDFEEFLRSRCFPETRDQLKLVLKDLELPFYDPLLIIAKTEGRMAEDEFWIRMERKE